MATTALAALAVLYLGWRAHDQWTLVSRLNGLGADFHGTIWSADRSILHGRSPYPDPAAIRTVAGVPPAVYLPPIFLATLPLGLVPLHAATWAWFALLLCATLAIPAVLGVRDPWCFALWTLSVPAVGALALGNATILVALGAALAWRFRDRPLAGPLAAAAAVSIKLWLWPLLVWLLITRPRAAVRAVLALAALTCASWAAIRFDGLRDYPAIVHAEGRQFIQVSVLLIAALARNHVAAKAAVAIGAGVAAALLSLAFARRESDLQSYALALLAALVATPVAWPHYLLLVAIPLVIRRPSLSPAWLWFPGTALALQLAAHVPGHGQPLEAYTYCFLAAAATGVAVLGPSPRPALGLEARG